MINVSSLMGHMSPPYMSAYSLTKHAIQSFSDALRLEMYKWRVSVTVIEPGNFAGATNWLEVNT